VRRAHGVCALDTELLGHFWHEGPAWLAAVIEEAGDELRPLDELLGDADPAPSDLPATSWGTPRDLSTWSAPAAGGLAWRQRSAELRMAGAPERALRELLALQSSDWAFLITHGTAGDYPRERFDGHWRAFEAALAGELDGPLRNLAPHMVTP
jgi:1,4-alpha-glucan branching enzyme